MSICSSCQAINPDNYSFCQFCGTKIAIPISVNISEDVELVSELDTNLNTNLNTNINLPQTTLEAELEPSINLSIPEPEAAVADESFVDIADSNIAESNQVSDSPMIEESGAIATSVQPIELPNQTDEIELVTEQIIDITDSNDSNNDISQEEGNNCNLQYKLHNLIYAGKTDVGKQRDRNEDDFVTIVQSQITDGKSQPSDRHFHGLFVLCDGMGGHDGGDKASAIAVQSISQQFAPFWKDTLPGESKLRDIISNANQTIFLENEGKQSQSRMGTTLAMMALHDLSAVIAHVGDSRIYQVTQGQNADSEPQLSQITRDHEVYNQLIDRGVEREVALSRPDSHQLTQALGPNPADRLEPAIHFFSISEPTLFLLCSDGLCDNDVIENHWRSHLLPVLQGGMSVQDALDQLLELGNDINGHDNLTAILLLCETVLDTDELVTNVTFPIV